MGADIVAEEEMEKVLDFQFPRRGHLLLVKQKCTKHVKEEKQNKPDKVCHPAWAEMQLSAKWLLKKTR